MPLQHIKKFMTRFYDKIFVTLWVDGFLFSTLIGIAQHSLVLTVLMLVGLSWLICRPKGTVYMVVAMSISWGYIGASIGYSFGGWIWAMIFGSLFLIQGLRIHWRKLQLSWVDVKFGVKDKIQYQYNWYLRRQNLN